MCSDTTCNATWGRSSQVTTRRLSQKPHGAHCPLRPGDRPIPEGPSLPGGWGGAALGSRQQSLQGGGWGGCPGLRRGCPSLQAVRAGQRGSCGAAHSRPPLPSSRFPPQRRYSTGSEGCVVASGLGGQLRIPQGPMNVASGQGPLAQASLLHQQERPHCHPATVLSSRGAEGHTSRWGGLTRFPDAGGRANAGASPHPLLGSTPGSSRGSPPPGCWEGMRPGPESHGGWGGEGGTRPRRLDFSWLHHWPST